VWLSFENLSVKALYAAEGFLVTVHWGDILKFIFEISSLFTEMIYIGAIEFGIRAKYGKRSVFWHWNALVIHLTIPIAYVLSLWLGVTGTITFPEFRFSNCLSLLVWIVQLFGL
jgi:hypothetical protein